MDHVQIQYVDPWEVLGEHEKPNITRVRFHVYQPLTKAVEKIDIQLTNDTGTLVVLVRSPNPKVEKGYDYYILARKKFQMGARMSKITEFSRGYADGLEGNDIGWFLFRRDFPGLESQIFIKSVWHDMLENPVFENSSDRMNMNSNHLVMVTLNQPMTKEDLQSYLTRSKLEAEYVQKRDSFPNLDALMEQDLFSAPVVMTLTEVADTINAHIEKSEEAKEWNFGELFSMNCWKAFVAVYGDQFPEIRPKQRVLPE